MIQVYTGEGKGKTTAALGLALRASGAGLRVHIIQFIKGMPYSELKAIKQLKGVRLDQCGRGCFIKTPSREDMLCAQRGLCTAKASILGKEYDVVILDEVNVALSLGLLKTKEVLGILRRAPRHKEIILTGRLAPSAIIRKADLVSYIKEVKHYYRRGICARKGIEY